MMSQTPTPWLCHPLVWDLQILPHLTLVSQSAVAMRLRAYYLPGILLGVCFLISLATAGPLLCFPLFSQVLQAKGQSGTDRSSEAGGQGFLGGQWKLGTRWGHTGVREKLCGSQSSLPLTKTVLRQNHTRGVLCVLFGGYFWSCHWVRLRHRKVVGKITLLNINIFFFVLIRFFPSGQVEGQRLQRPICCPQNKLSLDQYNN